MSKVRLYEDIDGCLNASFNARAWRDKDNPEDDGGYLRGHAEPQHNDRGEDTGFPLGRYRMEWNSRLIEALNTLDVEFVWATTWRRDAFAVGKLMGLIHHPQRVLHPIEGFTSFPSIEWKWAAIVQEQEFNPSPFIAVDDEWDGVSTFKREALERMGGLLISPDPNFGITPADIEKMRAYVDRH